MLIAFIDDSKQNRPTRAGMKNRPMLSAGALLVDGDAVGGLERRIAQLCDQTGFPRDVAEGEFKWSPSKDLWMRDSLVGDARSMFFEAALAIAADHACEAFVAITDTTAKRIDASYSPEIECSVLCLERVVKTCETKGATALIVHDIPGGGHAHEATFLLDCLQTLATGTRFVNLEPIALNVLTADSRHLRCLQLADLIVGSLTAYVCGEAVYSPTIAELVKPLLRRQGDRVGGVGVKIHPDLRYGNLYHWLFGDSHLWQGATGYKLPTRHLGFSAGPDSF